MMCSAAVDKATTSIGEKFLEALTVRDFDRLATCFRDDVQFRALVPSGIREAATAWDTTSWLRRWFEDADEFQVLHSSVDRVADRVHIAYRFRLRKSLDWKQIEQQAFCTVMDGRIEIMNLLCSGFRPDPEIHRGSEVNHANRSSARARLNGDLFYDASTRGCAEGPLDEIATLMNSLVSGQTLEVHANDPSVARDLPSWCRMVGHTVIKQAKNNYLIRHQ